MDAPKQIELDGATVRLREDSILHIAIAANAVITVELVQAMHAAADQLRDVPHPVLTDIRTMRGTSILTLRRTAGSDIASMITRMAILVGSPVSRMIGNVMMGLAKPPYPTRTFLDEDEAAAWLLAGSEETT